MWCAFLFLSSWLLQPHLVVCKSELALPAGFLAQVSDVIVSIETGKESALNVAALIPSSKQGDVAKTSLSKLILRWEQIVASTQMFQGFWMPFYKSYCALLMQQLTDTITLGWITTMTKMKMDAIFSQNLLATRGLLQGQLTAFHDDISKNMPDMNKAEDLQFLHDNTLSPFLSSPISEEKLNNMKLNMQDAMTKRQVAYNLYKERGDIAQKVDQQKVIISALDFADKLSEKSVTDAGKNEQNINEYKNGADKYFAEHGEDEHQFLWWKWGTTNPSALHRKNYAGAMALAARQRLEEADRKHKNLAQEKSLEKGELAKFEQEMMRIQTQIQHAEKDAQDAQNKVDKDEMAMLEEMRRFPGKSPGEIRAMSVAIQKLQGPDYSAAGKAVRFKPMILGTLESKIDTLKSLELFWSTQFKDGDEFQKEFKTILGKIRSQLLNLLAEEHFNGAEFIDQKVDELVAVQAKIEQAKSHFDL